MLIILAGLPGVGKSTLAAELALRTGAMHLRIDSIEQAIVQSSLAVAAAEDAGYLVGYAVAEDNLRAGATVIADSVNPIEATRSAWLDVAIRAGRPSLEVEVICTDPAAHRHRVETRMSDIEGLVQPTWQAVLDREYEDWRRDRIVIDTANETAANLADQLISRLPRK